jgi:hypothetical protein
MVDWEEFERRAPEVAEAGRTLLYQSGPGLAFIATVRRDGAPRLHPICPVISEGALCAEILAISPKCGDLIRDGRHALHTFPLQKVEDEFCVTGRARRVIDPARRATILKALHEVGVKTEDENGTCFEFEIDRAMLASYDGPAGTWPPKYRVWRSDQ